MSQLTFFTSVGCMDGRVHNAIEEQGMKRFGASYADTITEPGFVRLMSGDVVNEKFLKDFKHKLSISTDVHESKGIIVSAHAECAGNPIPDSEQKEQIRRSINLIKGIVDKNLPVIGIFVKRDSIDFEKWIAEDVL